MPSRFVLIVLLTISTVAYGQITFNKYFPFGSGSAPSDVLVNPDSSYTLISQFTSSSAISPGLLLTKFDKQGNLLLQKDHLSTTSQGYYFYLKNKLFMSINKNAFLVIGGFFNANNKTGIVVAKINALTLDTVWVKYYSDPAFSIPTSHIIQMNANRYWLIGNKFDDDTPSYPARPVIFQIDTLGTISFRKEVTGMLNFNPDAVLYDSIVKHIYIAGINYNVPAVSQSYVACIDTSATVIWNSQVGANPYITGFHEIEKKNGYLILSGARWEKLQGGNNYTKFTLIKINSLSGSIVWQKLYGSEGLGHMLRGFTIKSDESIVSSGCVTFSSFSLGINWDGAIMKTDAAGEALWMKSFSTYTGSYQEILGDVHETLDKGYILCGSPSLQGTHSWVIKTDSLGNAPGATTRTLSTEDITNYTGLNEVSFSNTELVFYPNPAQEIVHINFLTESSDVSILIKDLSGRLIIKEKVPANSSKYELRTSALANGVYLLSFEKNGVVSEPHKMVISK